MAHIATSFPQRIALGAIARPIDSTEKVVTDGGFETRNERWAYPLHIYEIDLSAMRVDDAAYVAARELYYQARTAHTFLFRDFGDYQLTDELIGTGDGTTTQFQLAKYYGTGFGGRKITRPSGLVVEVDGTPTAVGEAAGLITFAAAPANGAAITATCTFDVLVRFEEVEFEGLDFRTQKMRSIVLKEVRE